MLHPVISGGALTAIELGQILQLGQMLHPVASDRALAEIKLGRILQLGQMLHPVASLLMCSRQLTYPLSIRRCELTDFLQVCRLYLVKLPLILYFVWAPGISGVCGAGRRIVYFWCFYYSFSL